MTPGGGGGVEPEACGRGGGGGDGHGEFDPDDDAVLPASESDSNIEPCSPFCGLRGAVAPGTAACFRNLSILSLYASLSSETSFSPSCRAFSSSWDRYLARIRSWAPCVAR